MNDTKNDCHENKPHCYPKHKRLGTLCTTATAGYGDWYKNDVGNSRWFSFVCEIYSYIPGRAVIPIVTYIPIIIFHALKARSLFLLYRDIERIW